MHQKRWWHQTGRRSATALRGIRVREARLFSRMWDGATTPLRWGFPEQPHHWEDDFWINRIVERTSRAAALLEERKHSTVLLGFKDHQEEVFSYSAWAATTPCIIGNDSFKIKKKIEILLVESGLHVLEKVNLFFLFQFWFMKYSVQFIIVLEFYLFRLIISNINIFPYDNLLVLKLFPFNLCILNFYCKFMFSLDVNF